jgi:hypothetical protein
MTNCNPGRPGADEYGAYYASYIERVPDGDICDQLARQLESARALLTPLSLEQVNFRPNPDDWNILEVIGHVADAERVFTYRALRIARGDSTPLASFDQDLYVANADFSSRTLADLLDEFTVVRRATLALFRTLSAEAWLRRGAASNSPVSVRALAHIIAGHELHHMADFRQRYNI